MRKNPIAPFPVRALGALAFGFSITLAPAFAANGKTALPEWTNGSEHPKYKGAGYMTAVGSGQTRKEAETEARGELARSFSVQVKSEMNRRAEGSHAESSEGQSRSQDRTRTVSDLKLSSNLKLRAVSIADRAQDPATKTFYALAVLDKNRASVSYLTELNQISKKADGLAKRFASAPKAPLAGQIEKELDRFDQLALEASILGPVAAKRPLTEIEMAAIDAKAEELSLKNPLALKFIADEPSKELGDQFLDQFKSCLDENKVRVTELDSGSEPVSQSLKLSFKAAALPMQVEGWVKQRFSASVDLLEGKRLALSKRAERTEKARNAESAFEAAAEGLVAELCGKVVQGLGR